MRQQSEYKPKCTQMHKQVNQKYRYFEIKYLSTFLCRHVLIMMCYDAKIKFFYSLQKFISKKINHKSNNYITQIFMELFFCKCKTKKHAVFCVLNKLIYVLFLPKFRHIFECLTLGLWNKLPNEQCGNYTNNSVQSIYKPVTE